MNMSNVTLTPLVEQDAVKLSENGKTLWKKQVLPTGKFNYKGEVIDFDLIGKSAKDAFEKKAMDQVAFQLADSGNNHNFDPKNYRGEVTNVEYIPGQGTFTTLDLSKFPDVADLVEKNPKFGVSAQIERDNKDHPFVFSHILGTLNPKVKGMKPWEKLELSEATDNVLDLTDIELSKGGENVTDTKTTVTDGLKPEEIAAFRDFMANQKVIDDAIKNVNLSNGDDDSEGDSEAIKLANERIDNALRLAHESQIELAETKWEKLTGDLTRDGVPPVVLSNAAPLMKLPKMSPIKLSNGKDEVDPQAIMLSVLESLKGTIDLSADQGHQYNESEEDKGYESFRDDFMRDNF